MRLHLEGMGVMGCLVALRLQEEGIDFTWSDIDAPRTAWKVSTGAVPVFGDEFSHQNRIEWLAWLQRSSWIRHYVARTTWCYSAVNPPHRAADVGCRPKEEIGPIKISNKKSLNMDVQSFVEDTRKLFKDARRKMGDVAEVDRPKRATTVITHGFGENIAGWSWGWSAKVTIEMSEELQVALRGRRPCFYLRAGYQLPYLYPVGLEREYYAGTTLITQRKPKSLALQPKFDTWLDHIEQQGGGHIAVTSVVRGSLMEGWRPMAHEDTPLIERLDRRLLRIRPQYGNGIRHFPSTMAALLEAL